MHIITRKRLNEFADKYPDTRTALAHWYRSMKRNQYIDVGKAAIAWSPLAGTVFVPHTEDEYNQIVSVLDQLIDEVGEDESHPLASLMEILGVLIEHYESAHVPELVSD